MTRADRQLAAMLREAPAWDGPLDGALEERAQFHGVAGLLRERFGAAVPPALREALQQHARLAAAVELIRRRELAQVLSVLAAAGVPVVLLKGTALAHTVYPQPYTRPSVDADLMVAPQARGCARDVLASLGYRTTAFQGGDLVNAQAAYWRPLTPEVTLLLDVHWRISTSPLFAHALPFEWLRSRARAIPALGPAAFGPAPVDALVHACLHRAGVLARDGDRADRLIWLYDIHLLAARLDATAWSGFVELATRHQLRGICRQALESAARWLGTRVPADADAALAGPADEPSLALLGRSALRLKWAEFTALPGAGERLTWLRETALPAPGYLMDRYGTRRQWLLPALYLRRAFEGLLKMAFPRGFEPRLPP